ncbi:MAG: hypothetical protein WBA16_10490 [Nonlabens sp.]
MEEKKTRAGLRLLLTSKKVRYVNRVLDKFKVLRPYVYDKMAWSGAMMSSMAFGSKLAEIQRQIEKRNAAEEGRLPTDPTITPVAAIGLNNCH